MSAMTEPVALVLDHVELLDNQECLDAVAELALQLPAGSQLALASRARRRCRWRGCARQGQWWRSGPATWPWTRARRGRCWRGPVSGSPTRARRRALERTEGWPVGLYLAALALKAGRPGHAGCGAVGSPGTTGSWPTTCGRSCWSRLSAGAGVVPDPDGGARPDVRAAVRRGPGRRPGRPRPGVAGGSNLLLVAAGPPPRVVPLPPPVPRAAPAPSCERREPELVPELHRAGGRLVRGQRPAGDWPSTTPRPPATPTGSPGWCWS